jgi:hypothetical protein
VDLAHGGKAEEERDAAISYPAAPNDEIADGYWTEKDGELAEFHVFAPWEPRVSPEGLLDLVQGCDEQAQGA